MKLAHWIWLIGVRRKLYALKHLLNITKVQQYLVTNFGSTTIYQQRVIYELTEICNQVLNKSFILSFKGIDFVKSKMIFERCLTISIPGDADLVMSLYSLNDLDIKTSINSATVRWLVLSGILCGFSDRLNRALVQDYLKHNASHEELGIETILWCADSGLIASGAKVCNSHLKPESIGSANVETWGISHDTKKSNINVSKSRILRYFRTLLIYTLFLVLLLLTSFYIKMQLYDWLLSILILLPITHGILRCIFAITNYVRIRPALPSLDSEFNFSVTRNVSLVVPVLLHQNSNCHALAERIFSNTLGSTTVSRVFVLADFNDANQGQLISAEENLLKNFCRELECRFLYSNVTWQILFRDRTYSQSNNIYMGWERKRGKLLQFCESVLCNKSAYTRSYGHDHDLSDVDYIMVLDEDCIAKSGAIDYLYMTANHPANLTSYDKGYGYGLMVGTHGIYHHGEWNFGQYLQTFSGTRCYWNFFKETVFSGKGLFRVQDYMLSGCFNLPNSKILSHDLPEGFMLRTALSENAQFYDKLPSTYSAICDRFHRWVRGDFQNIIFTTRFAKSSFAKFYLIELALRRFAQIMLPVALILTVTLERYSLTLFLIAGPAVFALIGALILRFTPSIFFVLDLVKQFCINIYSELCQVIVAGHYSILVIDALGSVANSIFTNKNFLEWKSSDQVETAEQNIRSRLLFTSGFFWVSTGIIYFLISGATVSTILCTCWGCLPIILDVYSKTPRD